MKSENTYAYPNPFNPNRELVTLRFSLSKSAKVTVKLYDAGGQLVTTLAEDEYMEAGVEQSLAWDGGTTRGTSSLTGYIWPSSPPIRERAVCKVTVLR